MSRRILALLALAVLTSTACGEAPRTSTEVGGDLIEVHRSPDCSCCGAYEEYLAAEGFRVRTVLHPDGPAAFRKSAGVPPELGSCHTSVVGGYLVEGHVPAAYIRRLLAEAPDISGIALPGMPPGSPGMGGVPTDPLVIYAFDEEGVWVFGKR